MFSSGAVGEIKDECLVLSFMHFTGDKYCWPSPEEKFTVPTSAVVSYFRAPQLISRWRFVFPNKDELDKILFNLTHN